ncbi:SMI1/KNR4 family protein [Kitasatospora sp. NPDC089797]|uniref:SMI1/KNR4 family protein n=1 Tax=Kitasatospora sp. NPDC089797 TaxID=3155298 RepID=UPI00342D3518
MHAGIEELTQVMSRQHGADEQVDWAAARVDWGIGFPEDFRAFMAVYGSGAISDEVEVLAPAPVATALAASMEGVTGNARHAWQAEGGRAVLDVNPNHILAWGLTSGPDFLCWLTADNDPDRWPVLVIGRHTRPMFTVYPFGMAEFLCRLLREDASAWDRWPLSIGRPLLMNPAPSFVHWQVQQDRWNAGLSPATGTPSRFPEGF